MTAVFVRSPYNYDTDKASDESGLACKDVSLAVQSQRDEVDINTIVRRSGLTGQVPENIRLPEYGDFTGVGDYRDAMNAVIGAEKSFMLIPADIRAKFDNDPQVFLEFCSDASNRDALKEMGLLKAPPPKAEVLEVRVVGDPSGIVPAK